MRRITTTGAACALVGLLAGPAFADCAAEIVHVKQMADQASDPAQREMAVQHLGMAQEKIADVQSASMEGEMMSEDKGMAMEGEAMEGEMMSEDKDMAMEGEAMEGEMMSEDKDMAMEGETMSHDQEMAMMEDECMAEVMKAQEALQ